jgi:hypothetical protein
MLLKDETIKLKAKAHTNILDMLPENIHLSPNSILNMSSAQNIIIAISKITATPTKMNIDNKSLRILCFSLFFSETRCSNTFEIDEATNAIGMDKSNFDRSKYPVFSAE